MALSDADGIVIAANPAYCALYGYPQEAIVGERFSLIFPPEQRPSADAQYQAVFQGQLTVPAYEAVVQRGDGDERVVESRIEFLTASDGRRAMLSIVRDVTTQVCAREALAASEERFRSLSTSSPVGIFLADTGGQCTYTNPRCQAICGFAFEESLGDGWAAFIHPDDRERIQATWRRAVDEGGTFTEEVRFLHHSGEERWVHVRAAPMWSDARARTGMVGTVEDLSSSKRAECERAQHLAQFQALAAASVRIAEARTIDALLHVAAEQARSIIGARRAMITLTSDGTGHQLRALSAAEEGVAAGEGAPQRPAARSLAAPLVRSDGTKGGQIQLAGKEDGDFSQTDEALLSQLARLVSVALENRQLHDAAQEAIRLRDRFLAAAAHELKTPVTTLLGHAQHLARRLAEGHVVQAREVRGVAALVRQAERLSHLIGALLDISRLQVGQISLQREPLDLGQVVRDVCDEMQLTLDHHALEYRADDAPVEVCADRLRLEQVVIQLIHNAIKYSPEGGLIRVWVARRGEQAQIRITDQGIGIPAEALEAIFTRFYRASNVNPRHFSGLGIGLSIVRELVTLQGGTISAKSTEGAGSTFTVHLPLAGAAGDGQAPLAVLTERARGEDLSCS